MVYNASLKELREESGDYAQNTLSEILKGLIKLIDNT